MIEKRHVEHTHEKKSIPFQELENIDLTIIWLKNYLIAYFEILKTEKHVKMHSLTTICSQFTK